jgi:hypothetical protein
MGTLASYLKASQIAFPCPTKFFTTHKALKHGFNVMPKHVVNILCIKSFLKLQKKFDHLYNFMPHIYICVCKRKILASNGLKISSPLESHTCSTSMSIDSIIVILKASNMLRIILNNYYIIINISIILS